MLSAHQDGRVGHRQLFGDKVNLISGALYLGFVKQIVRLVIPIWLALPGDARGSIELWSGNPARVVRPL